MECGVAMASGLLSNLITIQKYTITKDSWGQPVENWTELATVWADVRFQNGKEFIAADRLAAQTQASIRILRREVDVSMRIVFEGKTYEITAVLPHYRREFIDLVVKEIV